MSEVGWWLDFLFLLSVPMAIIYIAWATWSEHRKMKAGEAQAEKEFENDLVRLYGGDEEESDG